MSEVHRDPPPISHVITNMNNSSNPTNTQAQLACMIFILSTILVKAFEALNKARNDSALAGIKAGFSGADKNAKAGLFQLGGGTILAGSGAAQGIAGCKNAKEITQAVELRNDRIAVLNENTMPENLIEGFDATIQVETVDEPAASGLNEVEEEIFYDAEEVESYEQAEIEEPTKAQMVEKTTAQHKMTVKEGDKLIERADREYNIDKDVSEAKLKKMQGSVTLGQGLYYVSQSLTELKRSGAQKEDVSKQVKQDQQSQEGSAAEDVKKKFDKLTDFDPFRSNSSSLKG